MNKIESAHYFVPMMFSHIYNKNITRYLVTAEFKFIIVILARGAHFT